MNGKFSSKVNREEGTSNAVDELKDFAQLDISPIKYLESPGRGKKKHEVQAQEMQQDSKGKKAVNPSSSQAPCQSNDMRAISSRNQANTAETLDAQAPQTEINTQVEPVRTSAPYVSNNFITKHQGTNFSFQSSSDGGSSVSSKVSFYFEPLVRRVKSLWYCCQCTFGPHNSHLYDSCVTCGEYRCPNCVEEKGGC